jgi:hypothetical protein
MCCKDCNEIEILGGLNGVGISSIVLNENNSFTFNYTNGESYTSPSLTLPLYFYEEAIATINLGLKITPNVYTLPELGSGSPYLNLTYTNPSSIARTYGVTGSFEMGSTVVQGNTDNIANIVDGALVKTVGTVDTVLYESKNSNLISGYLFWGPNANNIIDSDYTPHFLEDSLNSRVEFRFLNTSVQDNASIFQIVTLQPGEKVSLMFKTKDEDSAGWIRSAQIMVVEIK